MRVGRDSGPWRSTSGGPWRRKGDRRSPPGRRHGADGRRRGHPWAPELWLGVGEKHGLHSLNASPQRVRHPQRRGWLYTEGPSRQPLSPDRGRHRRPCLVQAASSASGRTGKGPTSFLHDPRPGHNLIPTGQHHGDLRRAAPCTAAGDPSQGSVIGRPGQAEGRPRGHRTPAQQGRERTCWRGPREAGPASRGSRGLRISRQHRAGRWAPPRSYGCFLGSLVVAVDGCCHLTCHCGQAGENPGTAPQHSGPGCGPSCGQRVQRGPLGRAVGRT